MTPGFAARKRTTRGQNPGRIRLIFPLAAVSGLGHENDWGSLEIESSAYDDARSTQYATEFLQAQHRRPFFLACGLFRPHLPWYVPSEYFELYPLEEIQLPAVRSDDLDDLPSEGKQLAKDRRSDWNAIKNQQKWKHAVRAYLASISYADAQLGKNHFNS